jgi:peptidoglycan pentaglycine glycine transferase (the first glycine)
MWRELESEAEHWSFIQAAGLRPGIFLQSPAWAEFQKKLGNSVKILGWFDNEKLLGIATLIKSNLPFNYWYWFVPKGPQFADSCSENFKIQALTALYNFLKTDDPIFYRLEPDIKPAFTDKVQPVNPPSTSVVNLTAPWEVLVTKMHEKTRYNARLAERKGLKFRWGGLEDFGIFWTLLEATAERENFRTHISKHYRSMLELWGMEPLNTPKLASRFGLVEFNGQLLAASLILICNNQATYLHGASSREYHELMAPYLLHGEAMRQLQQAGCQSYDMWGVQPKDGSLKNWAGFTRFKLGWGGEYFEAPGTFDYPINKMLYYIYSLARKFR